MSYMYFWVELIDSQLWGAVVIIRSYKLRYVYVILLYEYFYHCFLKGQNGNKDISLRYGKS